MQIGKISSDMHLFRGGVMQTPEIVDQILNLKIKGWGQRRIAEELGISRTTVKRYLRQNGWAPYRKPKRKKLLDNLTSWLEEQFLQHKGNASVLQQELIRQHKKKVSLRTIQYAVAALRKKTVIEKQATIRFETPPGKQLQIDFGSMTIKIGGEDRKVHFFAAVLGYSRRQYVQAFLHERQAAWLQGIEGAFQWFGGVPEQILLDNARALVVSHNPQSREVVFNERFRAFTSYWNVMPKACAPYRARTKGKDENTVKYLKRNAIAGREFTSFEALQEHLTWWMREISDDRIHGTTNEKPIDRFLRDEKSALRPLNDRPPYHIGRELQRIVHTDACIEVDTNAYSVPWEYISKTVFVHITETEVKILDGLNEIARHPVCVGERIRSVNPSHLRGIIGNNWLHKQKEEDTFVKAVEPSELLRPLEEYESAIGGGW